ncbi:MAG: D-alanine--D-alanine ligase family protein [Candidatus Aminicenantes bacterium]
MPKKISVTILFGGRSAEHEVSLQSAAAVYRHLDPSKYKIHSLYINRKGQWKPVTSPVVSRVELTRGPFYSFLSWAQVISEPLEITDIYFPVLHGPYGEDGAIQGFFQMSDVPYAGASVLGSAVAMDKAVAKTIFKAMGLPVVDHTVIRKPDWQHNRNKTLAEAKRSFPLPVFVKPANLGSSIGIRKVKSWDELESAMEASFAYDRKILVEKAIAGRELECSVLGNDFPQASLPGEVIPNREFYDYRDKYIEGKTQFGIPADIPKSLIKKIQKLSTQAFLGLECRGMARADFFLERTSGRLFLNEINTIPGFTDISMYPKLWEASGLPFPRLLDKLIELGLEFHSKRI